MHQVQELIEVSLGADSIESVHGLCERIAVTYGLDHFVYAARLPSSFVKPFVLMISGHPDEWRARYAARRYMAVDPALNHCARSARPLHWDELKGDRSLARPARTFMGEARDFGLVSGVSLPIRGSHGETGLLSLSADREGAGTSRDLQQALPELFMLSAYVHEAACRIASESILPFRREALTPREEECLLWAAEGKTSWETAQILGIAERTVIFHLRNAATKLNAATRQQAIARAISQGMITPRID